MHSTAKPGAEVDCGIIMPLSYLSLQSQVLLGGTKSNASDPAER
jgi:hypothetical protein